VSRFCSTRWLCWAFPHASWTHCENCAECGVQSLLIGGYAVRYYGVDRNTDDVDLAVGRSSENALRSMGQSPTSSTTSQIPSGPFLRRSPSAKHKRLLATRRLAAIGERHLAWRLQVGLGLLNGRVPASSGPQTSTLASCSGGTPRRGGLRQMIPGNSGAICTCRATFQRRLSRYQPETQQDARNGTCSTTNVPSVRPPGLQPSRRSSMLSLRRLAVGVLIVWCGPFQRRAD
jgi:hypothetical protein